MTGFTFTPEQIRSAPPEVRRWIEQEVAAAFRAMTGAAAPTEQPQLAACTAEEALRVFAMIRQDFAAAQLFLELGREPAIGSTAALHALSIAEVKRHLRLADDRLSECFGAISRCFQQLRNDPAAALFGFDNANHVYVHETTHRSIRHVWEELLRLSQQQNAAAPPAEPAATFGFVPPVVGPSEDVAAH